MTQRTILFRGKSIESGEWVEGYFGIKGEGTDLEKSFIMQSEINTKFSGYPFYFADIEVDPATVGQFTGLSDKNGVKIFEGDIMNCIDHNGTLRREIVFNKLDYFAFGWSTQSISTHIGIGWEMEVIGSIHDK
jgi:uncharacterized phage protein (TIGR01671 family)